MEKLRFLLILVTIVILILWAGDYFLPKKCQEDPGPTHDNIAPNDPLLEKKLDFVANKPGTTVDANGYVVVKGGSMTGGKIVLTGAFVLDDGRRGVFEQGGAFAKLETGHEVEVIESETSPLDSIIDTDKSIKKIVAFEALDTINPTEDVDESSETISTPEQSRIDGIFSTQTSLLIPTGNEKEVGDMYEFYKKCNIHNEKTRAWKFHGSLASTVCADDSLDNCTIRTN